MERSIRRMRPLGLLGSTLLVSFGLAGCASFTADGGMAPVVADVSAAIGKDAVKIATPEQADAARARVATYLKKPLDADAAVQIALLNNRGLQADYNTLGIAEADYVAAGSLPNPTLAIDKLASGSTLEIERKIAGDLIRLATLPARTDIARTQFEAARRRAIEATFRTAAETRRAWYRAVAARSMVGSLEQALASANVIAELSTKLAQARALAFQAEVAGELAQARLKVVSEREALTRSLGLWGADIDFRIPAALPRTPKVRALPEAEAEAIARRVDLAAMRLDLEALAKELGLAQATRFVSLVDVSYRGTYDRSNAGGVFESSFKHGVGLDIQIPIFDLGEPETRKARETYMQAANRLLERAVNARSEVRAAYAAYRANHDVARLYESKILPLRKTVSEQVLLNYNGMLVDVMDLLTTAREGAQSKVAAVNARRDAFLAAVDLEAAIIGGGSSSSNPAPDGAAAYAAAPGGH